MRTPSPYLSKIFLEEIWPSFIIGFRNSNTKNSYFSDICIFVDYIKKDILDATYEDCRGYFEYLVHDATSTRKYGKDVLSTSKESEKDLPKKLKKERNPRNECLHSDVTSLSTTTIAKKYKELNTLFTFISNGSFHLPNTFSNHFDKIRIEIPSDDIPMNRVIKTEELDILLEYYKNNSYPLYISLILAFKLLLRTSELVKLKVSDITYLEKGTSFLLITSPSNEKRYVALSSDILPILLEYTTTLSGNYLISKDGLKPYSVRTLQKYLSDGCKLHDLKQITFNDIRNSAALNANTYGAPMDVIKDQLGMKSTRHLNRYLDTTIKQSNASEYINILIKK